MAHGAGRPWTEEEDRILEQGRRRGESARLIAIRLDRTVKAIEKRFAQIRADAGYAPTVGEKQIRQASDMLGRAIHGMFARAANDTGKDMAEVMQDMLGPEPSRKAAGSQPVHKTSSIIRLEGVEALNRIAA